jgi:hypothetical protein
MNAKDVLLASVLAGGGSGAGGGGGTGGILTVNDNGGTLDKTWQEIHDAFIAGTMIVILLDSNANLVVNVGQIFTTYSIQAAQTMAYTCRAADAYPVTQT